MLALAALFSTAHAADAAYPTKPIRVIVPTAPGGGSDQMVRTYATSSRSR